MPIESSAETVATLWFLAVGFGWVPLVVLVWTSGRQIAAIFISIVGALYFMVMSPLAGMLLWESPSSTLAAFQLHLGRQLLVALGIGLIVSAPAAIWHWQRSRKRWSSLAIMAAGVGLGPPISFVASIVTSMFL